MRSLRGIQINPLERGCNEKGQQRCGKGEMGKVDEGMEGIPLRLKQVAVGEEHPQPVENPAGSSRETEQHNVKATYTRLAQDKKAQPCCRGQQHRAEEQPAHMVSD